MQFTTVEIMGGLGNQLFQIFALLSYALKYKQPFYFSPEPIHNGERKKTYWLTPLLHTLKSFVKTPLLNQPIKILNEPGFHYQSLPFYELAHIKLFGYFQSYKYFEEQQASIYKLIKLSETQEQIKEKTQTKYDYTNTIGVHFRVGDYVQLPNHHPLLPLAYYTQALMQFLQDQQQISKNPALCETAAQAIGAAQAQYPNRWNILYFCEENDQIYVETQLIQKLQAQPAFANKFTFQCIDHQLADWEQMMVMSLCKHHIIANSTFSWWGAYFATSYSNSMPLTSESDQVGVTCEEAALQHVYYPATWFGPAIGYKNMGDLFPSHWQRINV